MDSHVKQENVRDNFPAAEEESALTDDVRQRMESMQLDGQSRRDNENQEMTLNEYKYKVKHLESVVSQKQDVLNDMTHKYNEAVIKLQQLEKANQQLPKEPAASVSTSQHPGGDICTSPPVNDASLRTEIQKKDHLIAELQGYAKDYCDLVLQTTEEKKSLEKQLCDSNSLNNKLKLQANDLVNEKDVLYEKLSASQSCLEALQKEQDELKENLLPPRISNPSSNAELVKVTQENAHLKQHIKEQEEKIEKLIVRCGRAEDDLEKASKIRQRKQYQPTEENNDWRFKSLDEKDEKISELSLLVTQQLDEIEKLQRKLRASENDDTDNSNTFLINQQLKAFQDDFCAEKNEKDRLYQENVALKQKLNDLQYPERVHYQPQATPHGLVPHTRQYTPTRHDDGRREEHHNATRPGTHLPVPTGYANTIPPHRYSHPHPGHEQNEYFPVQNRQHLPNFHREGDRGGNQPQNINQGQLRDPH